MSPGTYLIAAGLLLAAGAGFVGGVAYGVRCEQRRAVMRAVIAAARARHVHHEPAWWVLHPDSPQYRRRYPGGTR